MAALPPILSPVLPLFSGFLPKGTASFAPSRPATGVPAPRAGAVPQTGSLFADLPPAVAPRATTPPVVREPVVAPPRPVALPAAPALPIVPPIVSAADRTVDRTEAALREAGLAGRFWRGDVLSTSPLPSTPSGFRLLDEQLPGGGWPSGCLTELLLAHSGVGEIRFLASTLSALTQAGREIVLLAPPHLPDPTGWEQLGIDMRRVLIVRTPRPADRLWALEETLKSASFGALVAWLPEEKALARHDALRRLQSAAASASGLTFLMRPSAAQDHASPAPLRLTLAPGAPDGLRRTLSVRLLKRRGPVLARPLTLLLPEVHHGLKAFGLPQAAPATSTRSAPSVSAPAPVRAAPALTTAAPTTSSTASFAPASVASATASASASTASASPASLPSVLRAPPATLRPAFSIAPHALAGSLLSDAAA